MKTRVVVLAIALGGLGAACSHGSSHGTPTPTPVPTPPSVGAVIDHAGRALTEQALIETFDLSASTKATQRAAWEADGNVAQWGTTWAPTIQAPLAVWDGIDATCTNQMFYSGPRTPTSYASFAQLLADDRLYVDLDVTTCTQYFGVELAVAAGTTPTDCGGRTPSEDAVDVTYSVTDLSLAQVGSGTYVTDGVGADDGAQTTTFPFFGAP